MLTSFRLRVLWFFLALLAAFVLFAEYVMVGGGRADPIQTPVQPAATEMPSPQTRDISESTWLIAGDRG